MAFYLQLFGSVVILAIVPKADHEFLYLYYKDTLSERKTWNCLKRIISSKPSLSFTPIQFSRAYRYTDQTQRKPIGQKSFHLKHLVLVFLFRLVASYHLQFDSIVFLCVCQQQGNAMDNKTHSQPTREREKQSWKEGKINFIVLFNCPQNRTDWNNSSLIVKQDVL